MSTCALLVIYMLVLDENSLPLLFLNLFLIKDENSYTQSRDEETETRRRR